ncbi:MAG: phage head-tail connector protein [Rhizobiales bacterium]|nr:phage head-tail connector protein [Hyphomicrobiales bacterium]
MSLTLITAPALEPITLSEAKLHLRVDSTDEDALITSLIVAARRLAEHQMGRVLITQTWELRLDEFPDDDIDLPMAGLLGITSVKYLDVANVEQTVAPGNYTLDAAVTPALVRLAAGASWPGTYAVANAVKVRFTAGYGPAAADVPANVVAYIKLQIGALYRHREAFAAGVQVAELPNRFTAALLDGERVYL